MAKTKKNTKLKSGFLAKFSKQQIIIALVFILGFGGFGVWKLVLSQAAVGVNGRIAFKCDDSTKSYISGLCTINPDGTAQRQIIQAGDGKGILNPVWSPDGTKIVFSYLEGLGTNNAYANVAIVNADGTGLRKVTNQTTAWLTFPTWADNGTAITYMDPTVSNVGGYITTINATTGAKIRSLKPNNNLFMWGSFSYSPDGTKIVYISPEAGSVYGVYIMNKDGTYPRKISQNIGGISFNPAWSPDGTKIAFATDPDRNSSNARYTYIINPDGTGLTKLPISEPLTQTGTSEFNGWSPDSKKLIFRGPADATVPSTKSILIYDLANSSISSAPVNGINNEYPNWGTAPLLDGKPPVALITSPTDGATIKSSPVLIKYSATDEVGVTKMELRIDGVFVQSTANQSSGSYSWDIKRVKRGYHYIEVKAYDSAGNVGIKTIGVKK